MQHFYTFSGQCAAKKAVTELKFLHMRVLLYHTFKFSQLFPFLAAYVRSKRRLCPDKSGSWDGYEDGDTAHTRKCIGIMRITCTVANPGYVG